MRTSFSVLFREQPPGSNQYIELIEQSFRLFPDGSARSRGIRELRPPKIDSVRTDGSGSLFVTRVRSA